MKTKNKINPITPVVAIINNIEESDPKHE